MNEPTAKNVDDYALSEASDVDFTVIEIDEIEAVYREYVRSYPDMANAAASELSKRSRSNEQVKERTVALFAETLLASQASDETASFSLYCLHSLDRKRGEAVIIETIETCSPEGVVEASEALAPDVQLYKGEPVFDEAVAKVAARLTADSRLGRPLGWGELNFLRTSGYPAPPESDFDEHDVDRGTFVAFTIEREGEPHIDVERESNHGVVMRIQPVVRSGDSLVIHYERLELGLQPDHARRIIWNSVVLGLYADVHRGAATTINYHDLLTDVWVSSAYGPPD